MEEDLVRILLEPRNALVRQYQKFFEMENATLEFTPAALREVARLALNRETGARALRSVLEDLMLDPLYLLPSEKRPASYVVTPQIVRGEAPLIPKEYAKRESA